MLRSLILAFLVAVAAVIWIASGELARPDPEPKAPTEGASVGAERQQVRVAQITSEPVSDTITATATTGPDQEVTVTAQTGGRIAELPAEKGQRVEAGARLAQVALRDRPARRAQAEANLAARRKEYEAARQLRDQGHRAEINFAQAEAQLESAKAELESIEAEIADTRITAPFAGIVDGLPAEQGQMVQAGTPVAEIVALDPLTATAHLPQGAARAISPGDPARITLPNDADLQLSGEVSFVAARADPQTRTVVVEAELPNPGRRVEAGRTARLVLPRPEKDAHQIPRAVLVLNDAGELGVRAVDDQDQVVFHPVSILRDTADGLWVTGLPQSLRLITVGQSFVTAGERVATNPDTRYSGGGA